MVMPSQYVELDRRFRKLDPSVEKEETVLDSYTRRIFGIDDSLDWKSILGMRRVVVLGEAGSGKTREFRQRSTILSEGGQPSVYVPLDRLVNEPLLEVVGEAHRQHLASWRRGSGDAYFFLDSVDEAKLLRFSDFYTALDRFADGLGTANLERAHVLLSSRLSEWQPRSDAAAFLERLPIPPWGKVLTRSGTVERADTTAEELCVVVLEEGVTGFGASPCCRVE